MNVDPKASNADEHSPLNLTAADGRVDAVSALLRANAELTAEKKMTNGVYPQVVFIAEGEWQ